MIFKYQEYLITSGCWLGVRVILILDTSAIKNQNLKMNKDICGKASSSFDYANCLHGNFNLHNFM
ncbi:hypothetical protein BMF77_03175 [Dolichospermum sp. UHCC 0315A]|uniref:hypothetical protein n=1 Tax=Dolichospermum TaxID=748770 RepID=UPI0011E7EF7E|nr:MULTISPECIES: hypothetical protein [Dolichospermum]MDB9437161.1 hypothetical protein [Dolichospermum lemmermannii CS-548]QEI42565.1 hypothetical protein BMF77_03175 [Dolichospermum sp. UHCC 0315A]